MQDYRNTDHLYKDRPYTPTEKVFGAFMAILTAAPKAFLLVFNKLLFRTFRINSKLSGNHIAKGENIMKFPLLASASIDQSVISKFCAMLQTERAEYIRTYFYNHDLILGYSDSSIAKEFGSGFYESVEEKINEFENKDFETEELKEEALNKLIEELVSLKESFRDKLKSVKNAGAKVYDNYKRFNRALNNLSTPDAIRRDSYFKKNPHASGLVRDAISFKRDVYRDERKHNFDMKKEKFKKTASRLDQLDINSNNSSLFGNGLKVPTKDLMPINPTMVNIVINKKFTGDQNFQIVGIRYIPHSIPTQEIFTAFKFNMLNSRVIFRFIKYLEGDITFGNFLTGSDKKALNEYMTKIAANNKEWNLGLKQSTQAVTMIITKTEFEYICENIADLKNPTTFKSFQKDVGMLDLIVLDKESKQFYRINAADNYQLIKYDMRDALNANNKDLVINARIDQSKLSDED